MNQAPEINELKLTAKIKAAGCAAKISASDLSNLIQGLKVISRPELLAGISNLEDAAVYKLNDDQAIVQSVDFFPAPLDDPYIFGQVAACNALSDIYAMGGRPILALNIFCFPTCDFPLSLANEVLKGGADMVAQAGAVLGGGHSIQGTEPVYGLSVTGLVDPRKILTNGGAQNKDSIVITKAIGTGVGLLCLKGDVLSHGGRVCLIKSLTQLNDKALEIASQYPVTACTDVTGFGLIGHLKEMASASKLSASLFSKAVPLLPETLAYAEQGFVPAAAYANRKAYEDQVKYNQPVEQALCDLFYDPQTSGGLIFAVNSNSAQDLVDKLRQAGLMAAVIGEFKAEIQASVEIE